jgi:hypothetical protein
MKVANVGAVEADGRAHLPRSSILGLGHRDPGI